MKARRPRRIASDEAHSWARNLDIANPYGKLVLSMLSTYVNGEGIAWVGIETLAQDCALGVNTVRRRLQWLEAIGAISRIPCFVDVNGVRNRLGRGKRTSDDIQFMIDGDQDEIERLSRLTDEELDEHLKGSRTSENGGSATRFSPPTVGGLNGEPPVPPHPQPSPQPSTQPSQHWEGHDSSEPEPEPESPPTPDGGASAAEAEPDDFAPAWSAWPGHEAMRRDMALEEFRLLTAEKQRLCRAAIPHFVAKLKQLKRDHVPNFHIWIRHRGFDEFPTARLDDVPISPSSTYPVDSDAGRALAALFKFGRAPLFENGGAYVYPLPITAGVLAFGKLPPESEWVVIATDDLANRAAWSKFLSTHIHRARQDFMAQGAFKAPWPWPPRKDGSISDKGEAA